MVKMTEKICLLCGNTFLVKESQLKHGKGKYCSVRCKGKAGRSVQNTFGENNPNWKGGLSFNQSNYDKLRKEWRRNNPEAYFAHKKFDYAVRHGNIIRPKNCQFCGTKCRPDGHHEDYSIPLSVVWLCRSCHMARHQRPARTG